MRYVNKKSFVKTALRMASFFSAALATLLLSCILFSACGLGPDPDADGGRFSRRFYYYDVQECRYDEFEAYDCTQPHPLSPPMFVGIRVDSDGLVSLNLDGKRYYYLEREYDEGYDEEYGPYFHFYEDEDELTIYKDGMTMAYWDTQNHIVTYYYYDYLY